MAILWLISQVLLMFLYYPLTKKVSQTSDETVSHIQTSQGDTSSNSVPSPTTNGHVPHEDNGYVNGVGTDSTHRVVVVKDINTADNDRHIDGHANHHTSLKQVLLGELSTLVVGMITGYLYITSW